MKSDYTTNSRYITYTIAFWKVGRIHFLSSGVKALTLSLPRVINFKIPLQPQQKYITQYEEIGFSWLLRWKKIILPILNKSLIRFSLEGWEMYFLNSGVKGLSVQYPWSHENYLRLKIRCQSVCNNSTQTPENPDKALSPNALMITNITGHYVNAIRCGKW